MNTTIRKMMLTEFKGIYQRIELDFAEGEYAPYDVLAAQLAKGVQKGYLLQWDKKDVGYALCADGCANGHVLISLLAVYEEFRNRGLGSIFLEDLITDFSRNQGIIVEVEKPENSKSAAERELRAGRIRFYQNAGFYLVPDIDYIIWDVPMHLMIRPLKASLTTMNKQIGQIIRAIYLDLMGKRYLHKLEFNRSAPLAREIGRN
ncbi:GNAT family N-acetyltransferase [Desulfosporosinus sp. PR]|uniref:GNAT family N-acetyltransferase n=1 Tax=Candidatus Desulfosporosinus nitrosoreducens TaxID=3401928 RepID=UPI0027F078D1|nr:GNAT family N-acetyltransferase [Desulfosporosinus sp. PR]MDQ7094049.1 GNAT family N-acetyltransferase [Desulfosporosinus sp. PR]